MTLRADGASGYRSPSRDPWRPDGGKEEPEWFTALPEAHPDETEFDLDVRLEALARHRPEDPAERPQTVSCKECGTNYSCVSCPCG